MEVPTHAPGPPRGELSLGQWIALNDEIAALVRAGLPLERGLDSVGHDFRGRLRQVAIALGQQLEQGANLHEALAVLGPELPPVYRAVVEAGERSGRLASALEGLADQGRRSLEMRQSLGLALFYPMIVLALTYGLLVAFLWFLAPQLAGLMADLRLPSNRPAMWLSQLADSVHWWWPIGPVLFTISLFVWWQTGRASGLGRWGDRVLRRLPWIGPLLTYSAWAEFTGLLGLLVGNEVPLPQALELAGKATGDAVVTGASHRLAEDVALGRTSRAVDCKGLPPLVLWRILSGQRGQSLSANLQLMARSYQRRAAVQAQVVQIAVPLVAIVLVGSAAVLVYSATVFLPYSLLMQQLGQVAS